MDWKHISWGFVGIIVTLIIWRWFWSQKRNKKSKNGIPKGNNGWPIIGETLDFIAAGYSSNPVSFMQKRRAMYGKVFRSNILGTPIIVSTDAEVNKVVLQNHGNIFVPAYPKSITELFGENSILRINGSFHKRVHTLIVSFLRTPHFKAQITKNIETSVKLALARWETMQRVTVQDEAQKIAFEVLVKVLMSFGPGEDLDSFKRDFEEFMKGLICLPIKFPGTRLYKSLKAKERLAKIVGRIVQDRKRMMDDGESSPGSSEKCSPPNDVMDALLRESGNGLSDNLDFITGNIIEMMIPGEETVPMTITLAIKYLSDNPLVLDSLRKENMQVKKQKIDSSSDLTWNDYMSLPFTQNVISETLRIANIINGVWRKALKDVEIQGFFIPKDWCVLASFTSVHMNEDNYESPYNFDPWRWEKINSGANVNANINFTPFGGGQRLCPGLDVSRLELAIFLHHFVTNYSWIAEKDEIVYFPTVKMKKKLPITVTPIDT